ncbi:MAG: hypothetical protein AAFX79_08875 [Planctomycetota bacterium]
MNAWTPLVGALSRVFGLRELGFGDEGVALAFERPLPGWGWTLAIAGCIALAAWSYRRLDAPRPARYALAALRLLTLALVVLLVTGPKLERPNERVERDWVVVLVDRSVSMRVADAPMVGGAGPRATREEQLRAAIERHWPTFAGIAEDRELVWLGFDAAAFQLPLDPAAGEDPGALAPPDGRRTALGAALTAAVGRAAARPLSAIVVLSDGRSVDRPRTATLRRLAGERVPVHVVPLGSPSEATDVAVVQAVGPEAAFARDQIPVAVTLERRGPAAASGGVLRLLDARTGQVIDEQRIDPTDPRWDADAIEATLTGAWPADGEVRWAARFVPDTPDLLQENDAATLDIRIVDRPLRVLYIDGTPRWERRFLTQMLLRESSIESSSMLLASRRSFIEEGNVTIGFPPSRDEDWAEYDVIVLGDVRSTLFSTEQLDQIREHVAARGAGLLWIGGEASTPASWRGTPLEDLLPFRLDEGRGVGRVPGDVVLARTDAGERLGVLRLDEQLAGWPDYLSDPATGWSRLRWAQRIAEGALKPTTEILATLRDARGPAPASADATTPGVLTMPYGAGRVVYVATDEIWRYRYGRGEPLFERFYLPLIRLQARGRLARSGVDAALAVAPRPAIVDRPTRIEVRLLEQSLVDLRLPAVSARVRRIDAPEGMGPADGRSIALAIEDTGARRTLAQGYAASWLPTEPGRYEVTVDEPVLAPLALRAEVEVLLEGDELRDPAADHALLEELRAETGGRAFTIDDLDQLPDALPRREVIIAGTPDTEPLWDRPIVLLTLLVLLAAEWIGRRMVRLI